MRRAADGSIENERGKDYFLLGHGTAYERAVPSTLQTFVAWWSWQGSWIYIIRGGYLGPEWEPETETSKVWRRYLKPFLPPQSGLMTDRWAHFINVMNATYPGTHVALTVDDLARTVSPWIPAAA